MIPKKIYIIDYQLKQCETDGIADARINRFPYKSTNGSLIEYLCLDKLWHKPSEEPTTTSKENEFVECLVKFKDGTVNLYNYDTWHHWWVCYTDNEIFLEKISRWFYIEDLMKGGKS